MPSHPLVVERAPNVFRHRGDCTSGDGSAYLGTLRGVAPGDRDDEPGKLVRTLRALRRLGLVDLHGSISVRLADGRVLVTPRAGVAVPPPSSLTAGDVVVLDPAGIPRHPRWRPPADIALHLAIYRARPDVGAIVHGQPPHVLAFAVSDADLLPLTHGESDLVMPAPARFGDGALVTDEAAAAACARVLGERALLLLRGQGALFTGSGIGEAAARCHQLEVLAKVNVVARRYAGVRLVDERDARRVAAQRAPADDYVRFFDAVAGPDPAPAKGPQVRDRGDLDERAIRAKVFDACRLLFHRGLVEHLEHVSHRLPDGDSFLITPRGHMGMLAPNDLATIGPDGSWVAGPLPPPPFMFLHRDMFRARPEIRAIVHTHQPYARALAIAGVPVLPLHRAGALRLRAATPTYDVPDLIFDEEHRRGTLAALGARDAVHERSHGTDFLAATIEEATVAAIQYENAALLQHRAAALGALQPLAPAVLDALGTEEPPDAAWWADYLTELDADAAPVSAG